jgi:hypothetical protein
MGGAAEPERRLRRMMAPRAGQPAKPPGVAPHGGGLDFYAALPVVESFARLNDPAVYAPLPSGWAVGLADIVRSTEAVASGRYKVVNTAAASVIAAVSNALGEGDFPFVFGGDGASFALPGAQAELAREALAAVAVWVRDDLGLELRVALVPVETIRANGVDVRVARFSPSSDVSYAMFTGGGLAWAEGRMKAGAFAVAPAAPGVRPDLDGLSCRFAEIPSERGVILSLIVLPDPAGDPAVYAKLIGEVLALAEGGAEAGHPVPTDGPAILWPPPGLDLEARAARRVAGSLAATRLWVGLRTLVAHAIFRSGLTVGGFDPKRYRRQLVQNTDFRKFDDGLRMTLDCTPALADRLESLLAQAEAQGTARCGSHRQAAALMTCFVPSPTRSDHVHFVDGAMGGYAAAARMVKGALSLSATSAPAGWLRPGCGSSGRQKSSAADGSGCRRP